MIFQSLEANSNSSPVVMVAAGEVGSLRYKMEVGWATMEKVLLESVLEQLLPVAFLSPESGPYIAVVLPPRWDSALDSVEACSKGRLLHHG